jgi:hypothetical protein
MAYLAALDARSVDVTMAKAFHNRLQHNSHSNALPCSLYSYSNFYHSKILNLEGLS